MALLNHGLGDDQYESVVISGLAVLGFRDDGGWLNAEDYTTKYSGFIKMGRMLVVFRSYVEREAGYEMNRKVMNDVQARSRTEPMFDIVRRRVRKFMTLVSDKGRPTPMDWIYVTDIWNEDSIQHHSQRGHGMGRESDVVSRHPFQHGAVAGNGTWISRGDTSGFDGVDDVEDECRRRACSVGHPACPRHRDISP
jgi:hypothetical protein